jgi:VWFA-related protein
MNVSRRGFLFSATSAALARLSAQDARPDATFTADVKVVNVLVTVRDKQGNIIRNLTKDDFSLSEDGRPQTIRYFSQETNLPLTLGLLIDTSGSQRRLLGPERAASYRFLGQVLREATDRAFVIHFDQEVELLEELTSSRAKLEAALAELGAPGERSHRRRGYPWGGRALGGTLLYDAILLASNELMRRQSGRKALVVLTDGVDVGSHVGLRAAIEAAQRADTLVYSIRFADPEGYQEAGGSGRGRRKRENVPPASIFPGVDGKKILQRISGETGGGFFEVSNQQSINDIYDRLGEELRNQYSLGYAPASSDRPAGYHRIQVATNRANVVVQARDGYYARN